MCVCGWLCCGEGKTRLLGCPQGRMQLLPQFPVPAHAYPIPLICEPGTIACDTPPVCSQPDTVPTIQQQFVRVPSGRYHAPDLIVPRNGHVMEQSSPAELPKIDTFLGTTGILVLPTDCSEYSFQSLLIVVAFFVVIPFYFSTSSFLSFLPSTECPYCCVSRKNNIYL